MYWYFDDIIKNGDIRFNDTLVNEKLYENISVFDISYKTSTGLKPLHITYCKIDGFIRVCGGEFRHLVLFDHGLFDEICDKIKHLTSEKSSTINLNFGEIRIDSCNSLPNEKFFEFL